MLRKELGFLVSRILAVVSFYWLILNIRQAWSTVELLSNRTVGEEHTNYLFDLAMQVVVVLALVWLSINLWFRADRFGGVADVTKGPSLPSVKELRSLATFAIGVYFAAGSVPEFVSSYVASEFYSSSHRPVVVAFLVPASLLVTGLFLLLCSYKPDWLTSMFSWAKAYEDEPQQEDPPSSDPK